MHRSRSWRGFALFLAIWLVACVTAAAAVHRCPQHDAPAGMLAHHGGHGTPHDMPSHHGSQSSHECCCLADCGGAAYVAAVPVHEGTGVVVATRMDAPVPEADAPRAAAPSHILPFANGPPHALGA